MSVIDWRGVLQENGIPFVERGPNVKRGEINIRCPFCGSADPSHHMGLNLESGYWACWRNKDMHSGKSPLRLLMRLLNMSYREARKYLGLGEEYVDPEGYNAVVDRLMRKQQVEKPDHVEHRFIDYPPEARPLHAAPNRFYDYFRVIRGFGAHGTASLADDYDVRYCATGPYRERVILGYYLEGRLVAYTGRAIAPAGVRYRDIPIAEALVEPKDCLYNVDCRESGGRCLVVVEGPLDALKIDVFGRSLGVRAVALSTNSIRESQVYLLEESAPEFDRVLVMMDQSSELGLVDSMRMRGKFPGIRNTAIIPVPYGLKDAAEMTPKQVIQWSRELTRS